MKKLLLLLLFIPLVSFGQNRYSESETKDVDGIKVFISNSKPVTGLVSKIDEGKVRSEYMVREGILHGFARSYYKNGQLEMKVNMKDGKLNGISKNYNENGQLTAEMNYIDGVIEGYAKSYFDNGQLKFDANMRYGKMEGSFKGYYENGQLKGEGNLKNGKKNGIFKEYDNSGKLISSETYVNGKLNTATTKNQPVEDNLNVILPSEFTYESYITKARSIMDNPTKGYKIVDDGVKIKEVLSLCEKAIKLDSERFEAFFIRATLNNVILQWKLNNDIEKSNNFSFLTFKQQKELVVNLKLQKKYKIELESIDSDFTKVKDLNPNMLKSVLKLETMTLFLSGKLWEACGNMLILSNMSTKNSPDYKLAVEFTNKYCN
jgi:antitoxin component YwqK of YwqJK toxin-antitoxin module